MHRGCKSDLLRDGAKPQLYQHLPNVAGSAENAAGGADGVERELEFEGARDRGRDSGTLRGPLFVRHEGKLDSCVYALVAHGANLGQAQTSLPHPRSHAQLMGRQLNTAAPWYILDDRWLTSQLKHALIEGDPRGQPAAPGQARRQDSLCKWDKRRTNGRPKSSTQDHISWMIHIKNYDAQKQTYQATNE